MDSDPCPTCNGPVDRTGPRGHLRVYCKPKCSWTAHNRKKGHPPREMHLLTELDEENRTATCSICGPRSTIWRGGKQRYRWRCAQQVRTQVSRAKERDPHLERVRKWRSRGVKGIDVGTFDSLVLSQEGRCAICVTQLVKPQLDHCHDTGSVRGLLCTTCNTGLGKFGDNPARLRAAADYLERVMR